ncbi:MAG: alpha/beta hydrolase-fold protein [Lentisphaeraceae bacterium]|nr:alpha/beta hydrolase-fold protein [Lentisphaeraceae bacterium]
MIKNVCIAGFLLGSILSSSGYADEKPKKKEVVKPKKKKKRPQPPTRLYDAPGSPKFTIIDDAKLTQKDLLDREGNFVDGPKYEKAPESIKNKNVPEGKYIQFELDSTKGTIYNPGIARKVFGTVDPNNPKTLIVETHEVDYKRPITVYIPAQYKPGTVSPFMVIHDGPKKMGWTNKNQATIFDNLIAQKRIPSMIVISVANGGGDAQGHQRGKEYDTMSGLLAEYIETHVLPEVEKRCDVKLTKDPNARVVMGNSSGASAALAMAWYRNDLYQRVISFSGTFVNQQWPFNPETPGGAWDFHDKLIPNSDVKPLRIWMGIGDRDLLNPNVMRDNMHDWVEANNRMAKVLAAKGYHYQYLFCKDNGHGMRSAKTQYIAHAVEWIWRDYKK